MKQAYLKGKVKGLRPSQRRRLENIIHRKHPASSGANKSTLECISNEVNLLGHNLHSVIDTRGLCRILWVGSLDKSKEFISELNEIRGRKTRNWRLISCVFNKSINDLEPSQEDLLSAFDLAPSSWMIFSTVKDYSGSQIATLWTFDPQNKNGWKFLKKDTLEKLCEPNDLAYSSEKNMKFSEKIVKERVLLLAQTSTNKLRNQRDIAELESLIRSAGASLVGTASQKKSSLNPQTIWGTGKLKEIALEVKRKKASLVLTDRDLTPSQAKNLEYFLSCPVMDRSELILDIFAQRASSSNGRLQVELAQLRYRLPRLIGRGRSLSRQGGGIGTRGPGETQLEKDKRAIVRKIDRLGKDLKQLEIHRARLRKRRKYIHRVSLVGYTNVGKSSLLNSLCDLNSSNQVFSANKLFATLDPMTRRLRLPNEGGPPYELLITDTVGFINDLPSSLLEAFRSTLEETREADLLLILVDLSNPDWHFQLETVNNILNSLGAPMNRQILANKIDLCESNALSEIRNLYEKVFYISATSGAGLQGLRNWLRNHFWPNEPKSTNITLMNENN